MAFSKAELIVILRKQESTKGFVIPAKAGIDVVLRQTQKWIPAFAGMNNVVLPRSNGQTQ